MTVAEFINKVGFKVKDDDIKNVNDTISGIKNTATRLLGALGVGLSLTAVNGLVEEFTRVNDQIRNATDALGDQKEIQEQIMAAAEATRTSYSNTANTISMLVKGNSELFADVNEAVKFNNAATMLFKSAGKTNEDIASLMEAINKSFQKGYVDSETISQLLERAPEAVALLNKRLGTTSNQLEEMASSGAMSVADLKAAFIDSAEEIEAEFGNVQYRITEALTVIRSKWGLWLAQTNETLGITDSIGRRMVSVFNKGIGVLNRVRNGVVWLTDKLGGVDNMFRLIAIAAGIAFAVFKFDKITIGLTAVSKLLTGVRLKTLEIVAVVAILVLLIDDFINFMQGNSSVLGTLLARAGVDVDKFRENIIKIWSNVKTILTAIWQGIQNVAIPIFQGIWNAVKSAFEAIGNTIEEVAPGVADFVDQLANGNIDTDQWITVGEAIANIGIAIAGCIAILKTASSIIGIIYTVVGVFGALHKVFTTVIPAAKILSAAVKGAGIAISFLTSPIGMVVIAIGALIAIIVLLATHWGQVKEAAAAAWEMIKNAWSDAADWFNQNVIQPIIAFFSALWSSITTTVGNIKTAIIEGFQAAIDWIKALPDQAVQWGADIINGIVSGIKGAAGAVGDAVSGVASKIASFLHFSEPDEGPLSDFHTYMPDMIDLMVKGIQAGKEKVKGALGKLTENMSMSVKAKPENVGDVDVDDNGNDEKPKPKPSSFGFLDGLNSGIEKARLLVGNAARKMAVLASVGSVKPSTAAVTTGSSQISKSVVQNVEINNQFHGDKAIQRKAAGAMEQSAKDVTSELARGLAYTR